MSEEEKVENAPEEGQNTEEVGGVATPPEVAPEATPASDTAVPEGEEVAEKAPEADKPAEPVEPTPEV